MPVCLCLVSTPLFRVELACSPLLIPQGGGNWDSSWPGTLPTSI